MWKLCRWGCLVRKGDSLYEAKIKTQMFPFALFIFLTTVTNIFFRGDLWNIIQVGLAVAAFAMALFMFGVVSNIIPAAYALDAMLVFCTVGVCAVDLGQAALSLPFRAWAYVVLILDMALVFKRNHMPFFIIPVMLVYHTILQLESVVKFGLYDVGYWGTAGVEISACSCVSPPCEATPGHALIHLVQIFTIFLADFYFTRVFANGLRLQLRRVEAAVDVSGEIASALARYDVDKADAAIVDEDLPEELAESYRHLVWYLRRYRAYLPHSCRVQDAQENEVQENEASDKSFFGDESEGSEGSQDSHPSPSNKAASPGGGIATIAVQVQGAPETSPPQRRRQLCLRIKPRRRNVSLAARNMVGYLSFAAGFTSRDHTEWMAHDVQCWCAEVAAAKGVVDLFGGDRRYATFNARRTCNGHASAAVGVLASRETYGNWTGCVVSGQAVCGNYGDSAAMRFMVLGVVPCFLHPLERVAAQWGIKALVDGVAFCFASQRWKGSLLGAVFFPKRGPLAFELYGITTPKQDNHSHGGDSVPLGPEEWISPKEEEGGDSKLIEHIVSTKVAEIREGRLPPGWKEPETPPGVWMMNEVGLKAC
eukprot:Hpha_TRINITY_DN16029_c1_g2::TRINITY_DN16029_c1_g2_i1::g.119292::m.119292